MRRRLSATTPGRWPGVFFLACLLLVMGCGPGPVYRARELDQRPYPLQPIDVPRPALPGIAQYYGTIQLDIVVSAHGKAEKVDVVNAQVPQAYRDAAVHAFESVDWEPGRRGGKAVRSVKRVEVSFEPPPMGSRAPMQPEQ